MEFGTAQRSSIALAVERRFNELEWGVQLQAYLDSKRLAEDEVQVQQAVVRELLDVMLTPRVPSARVKEYVAYALNTQVLDPLLLVCTLCDRAMEVTNKPLHFLAVFDLVYAFMNSTDLHCALQNTLRQSSLPYAGSSGNQDRAGLACSACLQAFQLFLATTQLDSEHKETQGDTKGAHLIDAVQQRATACVERWLRSSWERTLLYVARRKQPEQWQATLARGSHVPALAVFERQCSTPNWQAFLVASSPKGFYVKSEGESSTSTHAAQFNTGCLLLTNNISITQPLDRGYPLKAYLSHLVLGAHEVFDALEHAQKLFNLHRLGNRPLQETYETVWKTTALVIHRDAEAHEAEAGSSRMARYRCVLGTMLPRIVVAMHTLVDTETNAHVDALLEVIRDDTLAVARIGSSEQTCMPIVVRGCLQAGLLPQDAFAHHTALHTVLEEMRAQIQSEQLSDEALQGMDAGEVFAAASDGAMWTPQLCDRAIELIRRDTSDADGAMSTLLGVKVTERQAEGCLEALNAHGRLLEVVTLLVEDIVYLACPQVGHERHLALTSTNGASMLRQGSKRRRLPGHEQAQQTGIDNVHLAMHSLLVTFVRVCKYLRTQEVLKNRTMLLRLFNNKLERAARRAQPRMSPATVAAEVVDSFATDAFGQNGFDSLMNDVGGGSNGLPTGRKRDREEVFGNEDVHGQDEGAGSDAGEEREWAQRAKQMCDWMAQVVGQLVHGRNTLCMPGEHSIEKLKKEAKDGSDVQDGTGGTPRGEGRTPVSGAGADVSATEMVTEEPSNEEDMLSSFLNLDMLQEDSDAGMGFLAADLGEDANGSSSSSSNSNGNGNEGNSDTRASKKVVLDGGLSVHENTAESVLEALFDVNVAALDTPPADSEELVRWMRSFSKDKSVWQLANSMHVVLNKVVKEVDLLLTRRSAEASARRSAEALVVRLMAMVRAVPHTAVWLHGLLNATQVKHLLSALGVDNDIARRELTRLLELLRQQVSAEQNAVVQWIEHSRSTEQSQQAQAAAAAKLVRGCISEIHTDRTRFLLQLDRKMGAVRSSVQRLGIQRVCDLFASQLCEYTSSDPFDSVEMACVVAALLSWNGGCTQAQMMETLIGQSLPGILVRDDLTSWQCMRLAHMLVLCMVNTGTLGEGRWLQDVVQLSADVLDGCGPVMVVNEREEQESAEEREAKERERREREISISFLVDSMQEESVDSDTDEADEEVELLHRFPAHVTFPAVVLTLLCRAGVPADQSQVLMGLLSHPLKRLGLQHLVLGLQPTRDLARMLRGLLALA